MSVIVIRYDGTDITEHIELAEAEFVSAVNGQIGSAHFTVKDAGHTHSFMAGRSLTLDIDGVRTWGGYVIQASKTYPFPVVRTTNPETVVRLWQIVGVDYNVLFNKRIVWDPDAPSTHTAFLYDASTYDDTIINDIFDNYLDIEDDDLTRTGVQRIAHAVLDVPGATHVGEVARAGFTWKEMMDSVSRATGGVYCINPNKVLMYVDVETVTSDYTLADTPSAAFDVGYQNFELLENGSNMVNDMLFWGIAAGPNGVYVFSRTQDTTSISDHFRWQLGAKGMIWRQASADIVADSYVYGTPQSHRGGKDDAISVSCRVFHPLFQVGEVVAIESDIFGYVDALPLRRMTTTFHSPTIAIFDLWLSHEIDQPNAINEFWFQPFKSPPHTSGHVPQLPGPTDECWVFDDFNRTVALISNDSWGSASSGGAYTWNGTGIIFVNETYGVIAADSDQGGGETYFITGIPDAADFSAEIRMITTGGVGNNTSVWYTIASLRVGILSYDPGTFGWPYPGSRVPATLFIDDGSGHFAETVLPDDFFANVSNWAVLKFERRNGVASAKLWDPDLTTEPGWMMSLSVDTGALTIEVAHLTCRPQEQGGGSLSTDNIYLCSACHDASDDFVYTMFDDFERTESVGWGTATPSGYLWSNTFFGGTPIMDVNGTQGRIVVDTASGGKGAVMIVGGTGNDPWNISAWTMEAVFDLLWGDLTGEDNMGMSIEKLDHSASVYFVVHNEPGLEGVMWGTDNIPIPLPFTFTGDVYEVHVKWEVVWGSTDRFKIWSTWLGQTEPAVWSYTSAQPPNLSTEATNLLASFNTIDAHSEARQVRWESIAFGYDTGFASSIIEDWETTSDTSGGWGVGWTWTKGFNEISFPGYGRSEIYQSTLTNWPINPDRVASLWSHQTSSGTFNYAGLMLADGFPLYNLTDWTIRFTVAWLGKHEFGAFVGVTDLDGITAAVSLGGDHFRIDNVDDDSYATHSMTFASDTPYYVQMHYRESTVIEAKVWACSGTEPGYQVFGPPSGIFDPDTVRLVVSGPFATSDVPGDSTFEIADIISITPGPVTSRPPCTPGTTTTNQIPLSGDATETIAHLADALDFLTSRSYQAGTLKVFVNGTRQVPVTTDAAAGTFSLSEPIAAADVLTVNYQASGVSGDNVATFTTSDEASTLFAMLSDNTIDVIEFSGDYHLPYMSWDIERTRLVTMRPVFGGSATFHGDIVGGDPQFGLGFGGATGYINMDAFLFTGYTLGQQGIFQLGDGCHDMTLSRITVRDSQCNGTTAQPFHSWAMYAVGGQNISLPDWDVAATGRAMSGLAIDGGDNYSVTGWVTNDLHFAAHINPFANPITDLLLDTWTITNCGSASLETGISVQMENSSGIFRNMHATDSGGYTNVGSPTMTDGGGNSWS